MENKIYNLWLSTIPGPRYLRPDRWAELKKVISTYNVRSILEFGSGISTVLFDNLGLKVLSFETDEAYMNDVKEMCSPKVEFVLWDNTSASIIDHYDFAFVDGALPRNLQFELATEHADIIAIDDFGREIILPPESLSKYRRIDDRTTSLAIFKKNKKNEAKITVSILSWLLEDRLIKTLIDLPKTTSLPLNLCLRVQESEQISESKKQEIIEAASGFCIKDIFFTEGNVYPAKSRSALLQRSAITPFVLMTDNDMVFQKGSIDKLYNLLSADSSYGSANLCHNDLKWYRTVKNKHVTSHPVDYDNPRIAEVDLIGASSNLMRSELALDKEIIDTEYNLGTWDFDLCMNIRARGWKIALICDKRFMTTNDHTCRTPRYMTEKVFNPLIQVGWRRFKDKWGFASEVYPKPTGNETIVISRSVYSAMGDRPGLGILDESRLELMQKNFINSLKNQSDQDFSVYLVVGAEDNETTIRIKALDWKGLDVHFLHTNGDLSPWKKSAYESKNWGRERDEGSPERLTNESGHPLTTIMARMDTDDWVAPGWIAHMKHLADDIKETHFLINYQVTGQAPDGRLYTFYVAHKRGNTSPFIALVQKTEPRISPYMDLHLRMGKYFSSVYTVPPSYAFMVVHGGNRSNRLYSGDRFIDAELDRGALRGNTPTKKEKKKPVINTREKAWRDKAILISSLMH